MHPIFLTLLSKAIIGIKKNFRGIDMNNFQNNYLTYLRIKYDSLIKNNPEVPRIVVAIRTIEEDNRRSSQSD